MKARQLKAKSNKSPKVRTVSPGMAVKRIRVRCGWSQERLAKKLGLDQSAISRIEKGEQQMTVSEIKTIGKVLGVRPSWLAFPEVPRRKR
jgi:transcriptional regulator with XRE-family HTH domain